MPTEKAILSGSRDIQMPKVKCEQKKCEKIRRVRKGLFPECLISEKGMTLVELVVTFAMITIFLSSIVMLIPSTIRVYYKIRSMGNAIQVSDMIMDKISGELENAVSQSNSSDILTVTNDPSGKGSSTVKYWDADGTPITLQMTADNKYLAVHYEALQHQGNTVPVDWTFDTKAYLGYHIDSLKYTASLEGYPNNVIRVDLDVSDAKGNARKTTRYIKLYNYSEETTKILVK